MVVLYQALLVRIAEHGTYVVHVFSKRKYEGSISRMVFVFPSALRLPHAALRIPHSCYGSSRALTR
jgi:hypothetical protein